MSQIALAVTAGFGGWLLGLILFVLLKGKVFAVIEKLRPTQLRLYPLCNDCEGNSLIVMATNVHHLDGNNSNNQLSNLQSLCKSCHTQRRAVENGAFGNFSGERA